jgi:hypothetical protein
MKWNLGLRTSFKGQIISLYGAKGNFEHERRRLVVSLQNTKLMQIHFDSLRHSRATNEYNETTGADDVSMASAFDKAEGCVSRCITKAKEIGIEISVAVVDEHGNLKALARMDGAG